jgi:hypothetical protein
MLDIIELNKEAKTEDAWVCIRKKNGGEFWVDIGQDEEPDHTRANLQLIVNYTGEGDLVVPVHTHPSNSPPTEKDYRAHANIKNILQEIGARAPKAYVVARDRVMEFEGFVDERGKVASDGRLRRFADLRKAEKEVEVRKGAGHIYDADKAAGESAIFRKVGSAAHEDAWAYVRKVSGKRFWVDIGGDEAPDSVHVDNRLLLQYLDEGDVVELYHIHPVRSLANRHDEMMHAHVRSELEKIAKASCPKAYTILPGAGAMEPAIVEFSGAVSSGLFTSAAGSLIPQSIWEKLRAYREKTGK